VRSSSISTGLGNVTLVGRDPVDEVAVTGREGEVELWSGSSLFRSEVWGAGARGGVGERETPKGASG
jgi:hypothetical protein